MNEIADRLRHMGNKHGRYEYDIGDFWNAVDEGADEIDRLERIEIKYNNLCNVLNEQTAEIKRLRGVLAGIRIVAREKHVTETESTIQVIERFVLSALEPEASTTDPEEG